MTTLVLHRPDTSARPLARSGPPLRQFLARHWNRWLTADSLGQLSDRELRDIGLSREQIGDLACHLTRG